MVIIHLKTGEAVVCTEVIFLGYKHACDAHNNNKPVIVDWRHEGKKQQRTFPARNVSYLEWRDV